ncbi:MAG TPA: hypothetical protein VG755_45995 [Nannocystaceae bacterium]|nr:hypothetical protein [Nannocystaceae bacterium]
MCPRTLVKLGLLACLLPSLACGDDAPAQPDTAGSETSSGGESSTSVPPVGTDTTTGDDLPPPGSDSSTTMMDDVGSETGEPAQPEVELLVLASDAGGHLKYFYYRRSADDTEGPVMIVPPDDSSWDAAVQVPGRRVVYRVDTDDATQLVLGSIEDEDHMQVLSVPPVPTDGSSWLMPIPDAEAGIFASPADDTIYRVDFPDGIPSAPVVVGTEAINSYPLPPEIDALGRWTPLSRVTGAATDVVLARVDVPDPDAPIPVTAVEAMQTAWSLGFNRAGTSFFVAVADDIAAREIRHLDVGPDDPGMSTLIHPPLAPNESLRQIMIAEAGHGILYVVEDTDTEMSTMWWVDVVAGVPTDPVAVIEGISYVGYEWWSADGRWLTLELDTDDGAARHLLDVTGGAQPAVYQLDTAQYDTVQFSPDSTWMFVTRSTPEGGTLSRVPLGATGPGREEIVATSTPELMVGYVDDVSSDGQRLLIDGGSGETPLQLLIDLSQPLPATPVVVNRTLAPGDWAQFGEFSPDDQYVLYIERNDIFGPERLMIVPIDDPGNAEIVKENIIGYDLVE